MITIRKYVLNNNSIFLTMCKDATILHVAEQRGHIAIWATVDTDKPFAIRKFRRYLTGEEISASDNANSRYIGTVVLEGGYVVHIFELL